MANHRFFMSKFFRKLSSALISVIFLSTLVEKSTWADQKFEACAPQNCGNGPNVSYPFWIPRQQESYCGHPDFEITCENKEPVLKISDDDYIIRDISYSNQSLLVTDSRALKSTCPTPQYNFTLDETPFNFSSSLASLSFFYNCSKVPTEDHYYNVTCASNSSHYSFAVFVHEGALGFLNYSSETCQSSVKLPMDVDEDASYESIRNSKYQDFLKKGFILEWSENDCSECEESSGRCGFSNNQFLCLCRDHPHSKSCKDGSNGSKALIGIVSSVIAAVVLGVLILIGIYRCKLCFNCKRESDQNVELFFESYGSQAPRRYKYSDLKKMTNSFKEKLGQGGFGCVFKGKLFDGCPVAVKVLNESKGTAEEFINEVAIVSRTNHLNIVSLFGFCFEGSKRALIYEFMPNGSLEKFIYDRKASVAHPLGWEKLHQIAIGIARGLEYLHRGCNTRILHFDIKPHNILLDENFCPKISDFGMAKLYPTRESIVSVAGARGTTGYIAPEVFCRNFGGVSYKSDVYSYGMMLLEMVGGRKNIDARVENISEIYFPHWIYKKLEEQGHARLEGFAEIIEEEVARNMILVGLWCIQTDPKNRPSMGEVVKMLEGNNGSLVMPPNPFCNQVSAPMSSPPRS